MTADFSLSGGVALVTGAGSGIGRAIALGLADAGALVGCVDQVPGNVEATAAEILAAGSRAVPAVADVTDPAAMSAAVGQIESALGPLTLGANAAGIANAAPAESMPEEQWRQVIDVDLTGVFLSCQAEGQAMIRNGGGSPARATRCSRRPSSAAPRRAGGGQERCRQAAYSHRRQRRRQPAGGRNMLALVRPSRGVQQPGYRVGAIRADRHCNSAQGVVQHFPESNSPRAEGLVGSVPQGCSRYAHARINASSSPR